MSDHNELTIDYLRRELDAALARIDDLEAQLAAQVWRPVTDDWPPYQMGVLGRANAKSEVMIVIRYPNGTFDPPAEWVTDDGTGFFHTGEITECRLIN